MVQFEVTGDISALWAFMGGCIGGLLAHYVLRLFSWNWQPCAPHWIDTGTQCGAIFLSLFVAGYGWSEKLPGTKPAVDGVVHYPAARVVKLGFGFLLMSAFGLFAYVLFSSATENPVKALAKAEEGLRSTMEKRFLGEGAGLFQSIHPSGQLKGLLIHDVSIEKRQGGETVFAISTALFWQSAEVKNGYTELIVFWSRENGYTDALLLASNGQMKRNWESSLTATLNHSTGDENFR